MEFIKKWRLDVADSSSGYHGPKGGDFGVYKPLQQVLPRSSCQILDLPGGPTLEIRFTITLPARGRSINGPKVHELLTTHLPKLVESALVYGNQDARAIQLHIRSVLVQESLRSLLHEHNLVAFIGNGSILPRASGADPRPMPIDKCIPFTAPAGALTVTLDTPIPDDNGNPISVTGLGIPPGTTVITGGGFHGKSTLLDALTHGHTNHLPSDGRNLTVTLRSTLKIRAEDGRPITRTNITPFIKSLPFSPTAPTEFSTPDASGSTSMAATIQESLETNTSLLLVDEDTSATNFLIQDPIMAQLIPSEPITALIHKARSLPADLIIVTGGSSEYLAIADTVIGMNAYCAEDWTERAHALLPYIPKPTSTPEYGTIPTRIPTHIPCIGGRKRANVKTPGRIVFPGEDREAPEEAVDVSALEWTETGMGMYASMAMEWVQKNGKGRGMRELATELDAVRMEEVVGVEGGMVRVRGMEVVAAINRVRGLKIQ